MKPGQFRYFLAIIPPAAVEERVHKLKELVAEEFNSKAALRSPAHITLHMPFLWKEAKQDRLFHKLAHATSFSSFDLNLNGFAAFPPRSIYIKNEFSQPLIDFQKALAQICKLELNLFNATHNRGYNPHTTIAFRDLKKDVFPKAWEYFKCQEFRAEFKVDSFWLLKHDGKRWLAYKEFKFQDSQPEPES